MQIHIDTAIDGPLQYRAIAASLLMLAGDIPLPTLSDKDDEVPKGTTLTVSAVQSGTLAPGMTIHAPGTAAHNGTIVAPQGLFELNGGVVFPTPPLSSPSNVIPFPPTPPIPSSPQATPTPLPYDREQFRATLALLQTVPVADTTEYDKSGLPWDVRIHNKKRTKKQDGTWKLIKGLDPTVAQQVIQELSARRVAPHAGGTPVSPHGVGHFPAVTAGVAEMGVTPQPAAPSNVSWNPPPAPTVPLPPGLIRPPANSNTVPLPPFSGSGSTNAVHIPIAPEGVSFPPSPPGQPTDNTAYGPVPPPPTAAYKQLMDKLSDATRNKTLDPRRVMPIVQKHGAPNLMALGTPEWANLIPPIERDFDLLLAGLPVEGITG